MSFLLEAVVAITVVIWDGSFYKSILFQNAITSKCPLKLYSVCCEENLFGSEPKVPNLVSQGIIGGKKQQERLGTLLILIYLSLRANIG